MNFLKIPLMIISRSINKIFYLLYGFMGRILTNYKLLANNVEYGKRFISNGIPIIDVKRTGKLKFGTAVSLNNGRFYNRIGRQQPCYFIVGPNAELNIGNNVGISSSAIVCMTKITIEDNVKIGGNTVIYDTDFHSLNPDIRTNLDEDKSLVKTQPVIIKKNAFIGAHSIILKGSIIGEKSIIGAGSVVTKEIPDNEIWAGNPVKFVKKLSE